MQSSARVFKCLYVLLCLCFTVSVCTLVLLFLSDCMHSCARHGFSVSVSTLVLVFLRVCMHSCARVSQCLYALLCSCF